MSRSSYPHLSKPPIAEAVVELRVRLSSPADKRRFDEFKERMKGTYPKAQNIHFVATSVQLDADEKVSNDVSNSVVGVRLDSADSSWVVQAKSDGLAVSRLPQYESWKQLLSEVRAIWPTYVDVFKPEAVVRLGVRYVNRLALPGTVEVDVDTVLTAAPKVPEALPQVIEEFVSRVVVPLEDKQIRLAIAQAMPPVAAESTTPLGHVVLDIDASSDEALSPSAPEVWEKLELLRDAKNVAFFGSVTEATWRSFL